MNTSPFPEWCEAAPDAVFSPPNECAVRTAKFERQIKWRNVTEYVAGGVAIVLFTAMAIAAALREELLISASAGLIVLGCLVVLRHLAKRASNLKRRPEDPCTFHLRRQYSRQYDALRTVPVWYLGPLLPGMLALHFAVTAGAAERIGWGPAFENSAGSLAAIAAMFVGVAAVNFIAARFLKKKIEALDALTRNPS